MDNGTHALNIFTSFVDHSFVAWNFFWLVFCFCLCAVVDGEGESSIGSPVSAAEVSDGGLLYRVKSCPGIVDQVESSQNSQPQPNDMDDQLLRSIHLELQLSESREETRVQLRVRSQSRVSQTQLQQHRYSCGALEDHQRESQFKLQWLLFHSSAVKTRVVCVKGKSPPTFHSNMAKCVSHFSYL